MKILPVVGLLAVLVLLNSNSIFAKLDHQDMKAKVREASGMDNSQGAQILCGILSQSIQRANSYRNKVDELRRWEAITHDVQLGIGNLQSPEAVKIFSTYLPRMGPQAQAIIVFGLSNHKANDVVEEAVKKLLKRGGRDIRVPVACMEYLGNQRNKGSVDLIFKYLKPTELVPLQVSACRALAKIPEKKSIPALIEYLGNCKGGRLKYEANAALRSLTGQMFFPDKQSWSGWYAKNVDSFEMPAEPKPVFNAELLPDEEMSEAERLSYYEIPLIENRIVFLIDTSGSMSWGGVPNRLERAIKKLKELINRLSEKTHFNIITYSTDVKPWISSHSLVPANGRYKKAAISFLDNAKPLGGTQTMGALEDALLRMAFVHGVETVFLLTDGIPMPMKHSGIRSISQISKGNDDIRKRIQFLNQITKVRIHTIGIYTQGGNKPKNAQEPSPESMKNFLRGVAQENDGVYREVE